MQSTVTIRDYPCGSGKTTSMIEGFRSDRKYLVIVPLLTEVDRGFSATMTSSSTRFLKWLGPCRRSQRCRLKSFTLTLAT